MIVFWILRNKCRRVGLAVADIRNLVIIALDLPGSVDRLTPQFCRQSCHCEFTQLIAIGSTGNALPFYSKWSRGDVNDQILRLLREERIVISFVGEGKRGRTCSPRIVGCGAVPEFCRIYHRGILDPDLKAALRIFRRNELSVRLKVYQCLYLKSYILSIDGRSVICSLKLQTGGVLYTNCIILPKRRVVGGSGLFVVGFLRPDVRVKTLIFY